MRVAAGGLGAMESSVLSSPAHFPPRQPQGEAGGGQVETCSWARLLCRTRGLKSSRTGPCASTAWRYTTGRGTAA